MCDRRDIIERNIRSVKLSSPDVSWSASGIPLFSVDILTLCFFGLDPQYKGWAADRAVQDYWLRIKQQEEHYEEVTADEGPFIKIINVGERIVVNRIEGG
jgi:6-phosphofructo-2-kinase/fructose-2,6-biphosphatase 4